MRFLLALALQDSGPLPSPPRSPRSHRRAKLCDRPRSRVLLEGRILSREAIIRSFGEGDAHVHVEVWWAVSNEAPRIDFWSQQPSRRLIAHRRPHIRPTRQCPSGPPRLRSGRVAFAQRTHRILPWHCVPEMDAEGRGSSCRTDGRRSTSSPVGLQVLLPTRCVACRYGQWSRDVDQ